MSATHDLERFVEAQARCYADVVAELRAGSKRTHWMWFVFPQLRGLGRSATADYFGIRSAGEALAYWEHPVLGQRLRECVDLVLASEGRTAEQIFGRPDDLKFRSCMTLFASVVHGYAPFAAAIEKYYGGVMDPRTLELLGMAGPASCENPGGVLRQRGPDRAG